MSVIKAKMAKGLTWLLGRPSFFRVVSDSSQRERQAKGRGLCRSRLSPGGFRGSDQFRPQRQSRHCAVGVCCRGLIVPAADTFSLLTLMTILNVGLLAPSQAWEQARADSGQGQGPASCRGLPHHPRLPPTCPASTLAGLRLLCRCPIRLSTPYKPVSWCCESLSWLGGSGPCRNETDF